MKQIWISDLVFVEVKKASKISKRPMSNIVDMILTKEMPNIQNIKKLNEEFSNLNKEVK